MTLMGASNLAFCGMACLIRYASDVNAYTTTLFRFIIGLGIMCSLAMTGKIRLSFIDKKGLVLRGIIGSVSVWIGFISIAKLGLIWASVIIYTYPVFATVFGVILLKERINVLRCLSLTGAMVGIGILATLGQLSMTKGYRHVSVASGSVFVLSAPVINFGAGSILFHEPFLMWSLLGSAIVLCSSGTRKLHKIVILQVFDQLFNHIDAAVHFLNKFKPGFKCIFFITVTAPAALGIYGY